MGVQGLWQLLEPAGKSYYNVYNMDFHEFFRIINLVGRPVEVHTLRGKILAVGKELVYKTLCTLYVQCMNY